MGNWVEDAVRSVVDPLLRPITDTVNGIVGTVNGITNEVENLKSQIDNMGQTIINLPGQVQNSVNGLSQQIISSTASIPQIQTAINSINDVFKIAEQFSSITNKVQEELPKFEKWAKDVIDLPDANKVRQTLKTLMDKSIGYLDQIANRCSNQGDLAFINGIMPVSSLIVPMITSTKDYLTFTIGVLNQSPDLFLQIIGITFEKLSLESILNMIETLIDCFMGIKLSKSENQGIQMSIKLRGAEQVKDLWGIAETTAQAHILTTLQAVKSLCDITANSAMYFANAIPLSLGGSLGVAAGGAGGASLTIVNIMMPIMLFIVAPVWFIATITDILISVVTNYHIGV